MAGRTNGGGGGMSVNQSGQVNSSGGNVWLRIILAVVFILFFLFMTWVGRKAAGLPWRPEYYEWPLFVGPFFTVVVATLTLTEHITENKGIISGASLVCLVLTVALCAGLAVLHSCWAHLALLGLIFLVFCAWDAFMLGRPANETNPHVIAEIRNGSRYINFPTVGTLAVVGSYLLLLESIGEWNWYAARPSEKDGWTAMVAANGHRVRVIDFFTAGLVAFHLGVASISYLIVAHEDLGKKVLRKFGIGK